jgi:hypothetical protein
MDNVSGSSHKGSEENASVDAEPVEKFAQQRAQLSREVRQFLKQYDTEGSKKKRLKREKNKKVMEEMLRRSEEMLVVSEEIRLNALKI